MSGMFAGKVVLVTGASSGIGQGTAVAFAREGAKVAIAARRAAESEETARMVREVGGEALVVPTDVTVAKQAEAMVAKTVQTFGRLDIAFNNAGGGGPGSSGPTHEVLEGNWDRVINVNIKGVWLSMKYEIPQMLKQGGGCIVNMSSDAGLWGWAQHAAYSTAKWGVIGLTKSAAAEYASRGIRINAICPGFIMTPQNSPRLGNPETLKHLTAGIPIGRVGVVNEIASAVMWMCSDSGAFMIGHAMAVNGGAGVGDMT